jgi:hypothetical protein
MAYQNYTQSERERAVAAFPFTKPAGCAVVHIATLHSSFRHLHDTGRFFYDKSLQDAGVIIQRAASQCREEMRKLNPHYSRAI